MKRVDVAAVAIETSSGAPLVLLREQDAPYRILPIFIGGPEAASIAMAASGQQPPRPLTHDLMVELVEALSGHIEAAEVTAVHDGAFLAELALHTPFGDQRIDSRPSDAIALALRTGAPLFVSDHVMDEASSLPPDESAEDDGLTDVDIDAEVAEFRSFLDHVDPQAFDEPGTDPT